MNVFNGVLSIQSVIPVVDQPTQWDIVATFTDYTGFFYASDITISDIVYVDASSINFGLLRYRVIYVDPITDYSTAYIRVEWAIPILTDLTEPLIGYETIIGRQLLGSAFLPSASSQLVSESFIAYARNLESWLAARYNYTNREYDCEYIGEKDNSNTIFTIVKGFILETLSIKFNGLELKINLDYTVIGMDIILVIPPTIDDTLVIDFNRG